MKLYYFITSWFGLQICTLQWVFWFNLKSGHYLGDCNDKQEMGESRNFQSGTFKEEKWWDLDPMHKHAVSAKIREGGGLGLPPLSLSLKAAENQAPAEVTNSMLGYSVQ